MPLVADIKAILRWDLFSKVHNTLPNASALDWRELTNSWL